MSRRQVPSGSNARFALSSERLGPLPLINDFIARIGLEALLERHVPTLDARNAVSHAKALGVLLRSIIVEREPIYRQHETAADFAPGAFGLSAEQMSHLSDDRIGRALDRLFDADRGAMLTEVVLAVGKEFGVSFDQLHNDSTSVSVCGHYRGASGRTIRGRRAPAISLPLYPEQRACKRPTTEQILRAFGLAERHSLWESERLVQIFTPELTDLQKQILTLVGVPRQVYSEKN